MKKLQFVWFILILLTGFISKAASTNTVDFRITNPRILYFENGIYGSNCDNLMFDIEVKSNASTYYYALEVHMTFNSLAFTDMDWLNGALVNPSYYTPTYNTVNNNINLSIASSQPINSALQSRFGLINTSWQTIGTVVLRITDIAAVQNCAWLPALMDHNQYEKTFSPNDVQEYLGFTTVGVPITNLYTGRIYSEGTKSYGWSQIGGSTLNTQYLNWSTPVNTSVWDVAPGSPALIAAAGYKADGLRIHPSAQLKINSGKDLTCTGPIEINEPQGIWLASDATGTGSLKDNGTVTYTNAGSAKMERYIAGTNNYHYISTPLSSAVTFATIFPSPWDLNYVWARKFDEPSGTWVNQNQADNVTIGKGYATYIPSTYTPPSPPVALFTGALGTGNVTVPLSFSGSGWNLVGNPYPSAIDWDLVTSKTKIDGAIYVWSGLGNYITWNGSVGDLTNGLVPATQGFFVLANAAGASFNFTNACREHSNTSFWKAANAVPDLLSIKVTNNINEKSDKAFVNYNLEATSGFDSQLDAYKIHGDQDAPEIYSAGDPLLSTNVLHSVSETSYIPLGFKAGVNGIFTFTAEGMESFTNNEPILLEDLTTGITTDLRKNPVYTFTSITGTFDNRFKLWFATPLSVNEPKVPGLIAYAVGNTIQVTIPENNTGKVNVYNMVGQLIATKTTDHSSSMEIQVNGPVGTYFVQFTSATLTATAKVLIH